MYEPVQDSDDRWDYETNQSCDEVLDRAFEWRKGSDKDVLHTAMRVGYREPLKGRVRLEILKCDDSGELYRLTVDGKPLLYSDENDYGGWMTYNQLLCYIEGYRRLSNVSDFVDEAG